MHFKKYILLYTVVPLIVLLTASAYYRFFVLQNYLVSYERECDPYTESCFIYCEDGDVECTEPFYYSIIEREAFEISNLCISGDVTECEEANTCLAATSSCSVIYCDIESDTDSCENLNQSDLSDELFQNII